MRGILISSFIGLVLGTAVIFLAIRYPKETVTYIKYAWSEVQRMQESLVSKGREKAPEVPRTQPIPHKEMVRPVPRAEESAPQVTLPPPFVKETAKPASKPEPPKPAAKPEEKVDTSLVGLQVYSKRCYPLGQVTKALPDGTIHIWTDGYQIQGTRSIGKSDYSRTTCGYVLSGIVLKLSRGEFRARPEVHEKK
jgi:hypothetical protein